MPTTSQNIQSALTGSSALTTILTGGIYTFEDTGRMGITFRNVPSAFDGALLKPCAMVKARNKFYTSDLRDEASQLATFIQAIEVWLYQEGGDDIIEQAAHLVYNVLHDTKPYQGVRTIISAAPQGGQDESMNGASFIRTEYRLYGIEKKT